MDDKNPLLNPMSFKQQDHDKMIDFLNFLSKEMKFKEDFDVPKSIQFFKLLQYMQGNIIPKIKSNICEIKEHIVAKDSKLPKLPEEDK